MTTTIPSQTNPPIDWFQIAEWFLTHPVDAAINRLLRLLGTRARADRAWVVRYDRSVSRFWNTHEWARGAASIHVNDLQGVPVGMAPWIHEELISSRVVQLRTLDDLPRAEKAFRAELKRQSIISLLAVPILAEGRLVLQIGYDTVTQGTTWSEAEIQALQKAGRLMALALLKKSSQTLAPIPEHPISTETLPLKQGFGVVNVPVTDLVLIRADGDYSKVLLEDGQSFYQKTSMKEWETILRPPHFLRIHKGTIVALGRVLRIERKAGTWTLHLNSHDDPLPIGRSYRPAVRQHLQF